MRESTLGALEGDQSVKSALAEVCDEFANGDRRIPAASHRVALPRLDLGERAGRYSLIRP
jgi:hypothetical protein